MEEANKIYAGTDENGLVVRLFSSVYEAPQEGDILIEEGNEEYHAHVHLKYTLTDGYGRFNYRMVEEKMVEIPEGEKPPIPAPIPPEPTEIELAMMEALAEQYEAGLRRDGDILAAYEATAELYEMMQGGGV